MTNTSLFILKISFSAYAFVVILLIPLLRNSRLSVSNIFYEDFSPEAISRYSGITFPIGSARAPKESPISFHRAEVLTVPH